MRMFRYIILGGGNASGYAAKEFLKRGVSKGELCIITEEKVVAYERPALSKAYLFPESIEYKTETRVTSVDVSAKNLKTEAGEEFKFEKLIVATGARPVRLTDFKVPGAELEGLNYLRDIKDADALVASVKQIKETGGKVVVIGGGYIGMECSAALAMNDIPVTMVFPEKHLMSRLLNDEAAKFYEGVYASKGVTLLREKLASAFEGSDGKVTHVVLKSGEKLPADLVVVGVGARANKELFEGQLDMEAGGIAVNGQLRTSNPDVYAIGDVAAFPLKIAGGTLQRQEHVTNCRLTAFHAVSSIMAPDEATDYDYMPFFYSRIFHLSWQFYGFSNKHPITYGDPASGKIGMYWVDGGKVVGTMLESGSPEEFAAIKAVAAAQPPAPPEEELVSKGVQFALDFAASSK